MQYMVSFAADSDVVPEYTHASDIRTSVRINENIVVAHLPHAVFRIEVLQHRTLERHIPDPLLLKPIKDRFSIQIEEGVIL